MTARNWNPWNTSNIAPLVPHQDAQPDRIELMSELRPRTTFPSLLSSNTSQPVYVMQAPRNKTPSNARESEDE